MKKINIFIDMDGVLAEFKNSQPYEYYEKGYFLNLKPFQDNIDFVNELINHYFNYNIHILTHLAWYHKTFSYSEDITSLYCEKEKLEWLQKYLPNLKVGNIHFVPSHISKIDYVKKNKIVNYEDINILIDDYSKNILEWGESKNFIGIKMINNINDINKEWSNQNKPFMFYNSDIKIKIGLLNNIVSSIRLF